MNIRIHVVPYDSGHIHYRMGRGPDSLLDSGLRTLLVGLGHSLEEDVVAIPDSHPAEIKAAFSLCAELSRRVRKSRNDGFFPLVLAGNCNAAIGVVSGCGIETTGVAWFDAHGEATTPDTTTSGFLDGMGISVLTGQCWHSIARTVPGFQPMPGEHIVLLGSRDLEPEEYKLLDRVGVRRFSTPGELKAFLPSVAQQVDGVYVHFDLDVLDPSEATANPWTPSGGFTVDAVRRAVSEIQAHTKIKALGFASYDPESDRDGRALRAALSLTELAIGPA